MKLRYQWNGEHGSRASSEVKFWQGRDESAYPSSMQLSNNLQYRAFIYKARLGNCVDINIIIATTHCVYASLYAKYAVPMVISLHDLPAK